MTDEIAPIPVPGMAVYYQTDGRNFNYFMPAVITITKEHNLVSEAVEQGLIPDITQPDNVHLFVYGGAGPYYEYDVPYDPNGGPRTWRSPDRM